MSRVVIVARTRMRGDHLCIGGHDLDRKFRGVRLLDRFGDSWPGGSPFLVGEVWDIRYTEKGSARPPHVEDVFVMDCRPVGRVPDLKALVLQRVMPWKGGPDVLFEGTVRSTEAGSAYIPAEGRLPRHSTGYWMPGEDLERQMIGRRVRFVWVGDSAIKRFAWVGVQEPPERIEAGSLVRMSLSRKFGSETAPEGYYVQISGVL
jgi:hypothetical protein